MKLNRVLLLIFCSGILFVGVVSNIFAYTTVQNGQYTAHADAYRSGGINNDRLHVNLWAMAECNASAIGTTLEISLKVNNKPHLDVTPTKIINYGSGYIVRNLRSAYEKNAARAYAKSKGNASYAGTLSAEAVETVPEMPPPPPPLPPPPLPPPVDDGPCQSPGLYPVDDLYTATGGETKESCLLASGPYSSVDWYIQNPSEIVDGVSTYIETDSGDGTSTEARMSYQFPADASGDYVIYVNVQLASNNSTYNESYTVSVTPSPDNTLEPPDPDPSDTGNDGDSQDTGDASTVSPGGTHEFQVTADEAYYFVHWYVKSPSETGIGTEIEYDGDGYGGETESSFSYTFPTTIGDYVITARVYLFSDYTYYDETFDITVQ